MRGGFKGFWILGLIALVLMASGAIRFILPILFFGFLFFIVAPAIMRMMRGSAQSSGQNWTGSTYRTEKRKRDFAQAVDADYVEKPKRTLDNDADSTIDGETEYIVGSDGELEPVRRAAPRRTDDYV